MKCKNCGAEGTGAFCEYCGSEMPKPQANVVNNYYINNNTPDPPVNNPAVGCPKCGGNRISFQRETTANRGLHRTVGMCKNCGYTWVVSQDVLVSPKSKIAALILCILFGYFGVHYFYVGKGGIGVLYIFTLGLFGIGWIIDIIRIAAGTFTDSHGLKLR